ncbi:MAG: N-acetylmuramoyl-L-alanine amidase [Pseudomonadota bacterium]
MRPGLLARLALVLCAILLVLSVMEDVRAAERAATATDIRLAGDHTRTRLITDLSSAVEFSTFTLADPYRVVVDLPEISFEIAPTLGLEGRGLVSAFRFGLVAPGKSRIVIDTSGPVAIDSAFILEPVDGQPARLVLDLVETERAAFLGQLSERDDTPANSESAPSLDPLAPVPPGGGFERRPMIVLDPGHGGIDPGATSRGGLQEKEIVLDFALRLAEALRSTDKVDVALTRDEDVFIALRDRVVFGREQGASLFVSLHADSISVSSVRGATVYTLSERASDADAARLAEKENRADAIAGLDLSDEPDEVAGILIDLVRRETKNFSVVFARQLVGDLEEATRLNRNPIRSAGFRVLRAPDVPSVLLELGYITNEEDAELMMSDDWQDAVTQSMVTAILSYFEGDTEQGNL